MADYRVNGSRPSALRGLATIGGRAAAVTVRPFSGMVGAAAEAGLDLERRAMDRLIQSGELERVLASARLQMVASQLMGLGLARYILRLQPLAGAEPTVVIACVAPTIQRYLTGELDIRPTVRQNS